MRTSMTAAEIAASIGRYRESPTLPPRTAAVSVANDVANACPSDVVHCTFAALASLDCDALDVAVVDARTLPRDASLAPLVALGARVPILLVGSGSGDPTVVDDDAERVQAAATIERPFSPRLLLRQLRTLAELRRVRRALAVTNAALAHSVTGLAIADPRQPDMPIVYVSSTFEKITGYAANEVLNRNCRFLQGEERDPETSERIRRAIATRQPGRFLVRNFKKDGAPIWNELTLFPIFGESGELLYVGGMQHDVTELVTARAEAARVKDLLAARQELTRTVLDSVPVAVVTTDEDLQVTLMNRAASALVGRESEDCVGRQVDRALGLPPFAHEWFRDERGRGESVYTIDGVTPREIGLSIRRAAGAAGFFLVLRDLAESRQAERIERLAAVSTMAAGFAHEVRNPLASLRMLCEMLQSELPRDDAHLELVDRMMTQIARVERLVRTSLQFARPQRPRKSLHWPSVIVNALLEALAPRLRAMEGQIELDIASDLPKLECDDAQLVQVLVVLVNNALDATGRPEGVTLRVHEAPDAGPPGTSCVRFSVEDDGPGVPEHLRAAVFHPFYTTKPSGTGLGLSIAQQLVHEVGGRIELGSRPVRGAVFSILIPSRHHA